MYDKNPTFFEVQMFRRTKKHGLTQGILEKLEDKKYRKF